MTDTEAMTDERAVMTAQAKEREYTVGWRAYRDGQRCPAGEYAKIGYTEAMYAVEQVGRRIDWSARVPDGNWVQDETVGWQRAQHDRDQAPG